MVGSLVNSTVDIMKSIWSRKDLSDSVSYQLSLTTFIKEILKRSRTSFSTLQVTLFYLIKFRTLIKDYLIRIKSGSEKLSPDFLFLLDERKTFLVCLLISTKYLNDKSFSVNVWSKVSGLDKSDLIKWDFAFINSIMKWNLFIDVEDFNSWCTFLWVNHFPVSSNGASVGAKGSRDNQHQFVSAKYSSMRRTPMPITTPNNSPMMAPDMIGYDHLKKDRTAKQHRALLRGLMTPPVDTWTPNKRELESQSEFVSQDDLHPVKRLRV
ncbi:hypothetical protein NADFUDRAFT_41887 [Nadsonia fulvescens var. elongata DSM 6958]|uniref:Cyclin N-terminal domain-containing protein n=1 Tax=Nadsonia fulvescens var. elongata DSM 6958 TaxID=857566 RepID=A0A1E3PKN6_9ASCO|nr:hypothetical protein NADFUDRAFT_41887 [Nadsonia fulvescens var. elongata DSM 6958]